LEQSKSKIDIKITVHRKGEASAEIFRHLAPTTVNVIIVEMPIHGRVIRIGESNICIIAQISTGVMKGKTNFARGDLACLPLNGSICIFLKEAKSARPMNPIGQVTSGLDILDKAGSGDTITLAPV
jgi:hypothetical protein